MKLVCSDIKVDSLCMVNRNDLIEIAKTGIIKKSKNDYNYRDKIYLIKSNNEEDGKDNISVLVVRNNDTKKLSDSPRKIWRLMKFENEGFNSTLFQLEKMSIKSYLYKRYNQGRKDINIKSVTQPEPLEKETVVEHRPVTASDKLLLDILGESIGGSDKLLVEMLDESLGENSVLLKMVENDISSEDDDIMIDSNNNNLDEKIKEITSGIRDNKILIISERKNRIYLPYTIDELENYIRCYPRSYITIRDVIEREFIIPFRSFLDHPFQSRFSETYNLIKNREKKSPFVALVYSIILSSKNDLNPAIIAACKSKDELINYLHCLKHNDFKNFKSFRTIYETISA